MSAPGSSQDSRVPIIERSEVFIKLEVSGVGPAFRNRQVGPSFQNQLMDRVREVVDSGVPPGAFLREVGDDEVGNGYMLNRHYAEPSMRDYSHATHVCNKLMASNCPHLANVCVGQ